MLSRHRADDLDDLPGLPPNATAAQSRAYLDRLLGIGMPEDGAPDREWREWYISANLIVFAARYRKDGPHVALGKFLEWYGTPCNEIDSEILGDLRDRHARGEIIASMLR